MTVGLGLLAQVVLVVVLGWIVYALYKASRDPRTDRGDAVLLDLSLGLSAVTVLVLVLNALMRLFS